VSVDLANALAFPPALALLLGALLAALLRGRLRSACFVGGPLLALWAVTQVPEGIALTGRFLSYELQLVAGTGLRRLFALLFALVALAGTLAGLSRLRWYELCAAQLLAAAALGAALAGDLISLYLQVELMVIFATVLIWCGGEQARAAALRFALLQLLAGLVLKIGIEATTKHTGSGLLATLPLDHYGAWLLLGGLLVKAAAVPFSAWLADACVESRPAAGPFLATLFTGVAMLSLLQLAPGATLLWWLGLVTAAHGTLQAWQAADARRALAYLAVAQLGLALAALGLGDDTGLRAAIAITVAQLAWLPLLFMIQLLPSAGGRGLVPGPAGAAVAAITLASLPISVQFTGGEPLDAALAGPLAGTALLALVALLRQLAPARRSQPLPDFDWLWRGPLFALAAALLSVIVVADQRVRTTFLASLDRFASRARGWLATDGTLSRSWSIGITALWIVILLSFYVIIYYLL